MKIAVITHYYKSNNYGGVIQAYALCYVLNKIGYSVEQISYDRNIYSSKFKNILQYFFRPVITVIKNPNNIRIFFQNKRRERAISNFRINLISHSRVYNDNNIKKCIAYYDLFITGSDQVWHPNGFSCGYFLSFVPNTKIKISYAASISQDSLSAEQLSFFKNNLSDFTAISVREENAVKMLKDVSPVPIEWVLDPTMLLTREQWNEICSPRVVEDEYILCYFLGDDIVERNIALEYAKMRHLRLVTLPHILGHYRKCDVKYGDLQLYDVSPEQFISLIKYANYIFTDSFHATVFSGIYQKEYFVFERSGYKSMGSRIYSLTSLFKSEDHFCDTSEKATISYIDNLPLLDYSRPLPQLAAMKEKSMEYLKRNLKKADELSKINEN